MPLMKLAQRFSRTMRARRFERFAALLAPLPRPLRILDVGGTNAFWQESGWAGQRDVQVTLVNLVREEQRYPNIETRAGNATDLREFADQSVDLVFSNSVIEHLFTLANQQSMAREVQRIGKRFWVQTPNYWFPMEPHFHFLGWQWLPASARVALLRRRRCGWRERTPDRERAHQLVEEVRLLTRGELRRLFPGAAIAGERFGPLVKSWIVLGGFAEGRG